MNYWARLLPFKTPEVSKMKVCTAHDPHSSEVHRAEALLGIFFVSSFSAFLSEALLEWFCKHFFRISLSLIKAQNCRNPQKYGRLEALKKNPQNPHPWSSVHLVYPLAHITKKTLNSWSLGFPLMCPSWLHACTRDTDNQQWCSHGTIKTVRTAQDKGDNLKRYLHTILYLHIFLPKLLITLFLGRL